MNRGNTAEKGRAAARARWGEFEPRFWTRVDRSGGPEACWPWLGYKDRFGYGQIGGQRGRAYRFAYEVTVGPIPDGLTIDHLCRQPSCVNPAHLEPVTQAENNRRAAAALVLPDTCPRGHLYGPRRLEGSSLRRRCRTCARERHTAYMQTYRVPVA